MKFIKNKSLQGFTLVEIMVVIALFSILSAISLNSGYRENQIKNSLFTDSIDLSTFLQDMQTRSSTFVSATNNINNIGYGVFFDNTDPSKIESFYKYEGQFTISELLNNSNPKPEQDLLLNYGTKIGKICLNGCSNYSNESTKLAVFFVRPKSYANFSVLSSDGVTYTTTIDQAGIATPIVYACLELTPVNVKEVRHIDIYKIGQVSAVYGKCQ